MQKTGVRSHLVSVFDPLSDEVPVVDHVVVREAGALGVAGGALGEVRFSRRRT